VTNALKIAARETRIVEWRPGFASQTAQAEQKRKVSAQTCTQVGYRSASDATMIALPYNSAAMTTTTTSTTPATTTTSASIPSSMPSTPIMTASQAAMEVGSLAPRSISASTL
jgi:hypothetical protein